MGSWGRCFDGRGFNNDDKTFHLFIKPLPNCLGVGVEVVVVGVGVGEDRGLGSLGTISSSYH